MAQLGDYLYHRVFDLWALSLILCATCSLVCAIRIIPFLDLRHAKQSTTNATSSVPFSRFRTLATAHLSNTSSASKSLLPTLSGSHLGQHASSSSSSASQHMSALGGESPITPTPAAPAASTTSSDGRARAVQTCVRQLKMLLLVIALVLAGDVILVLVITLPDVLFTVLGWLSCRVVSVSLFAAVNLIRKTVIAKRKVPNPAMGSLATDWQGATTRKMG
ncbi:hypothetical protein BCR44DRAFT_42528 [Catenaria anguillulae PL171]|uniref:Uncharacterized protein n=1 Tax=Catenaria anguillulae PL171 TaxID=765915 RepID=A0A1Y2H885_9FUNG|nr:hypothetical protein BCR44DRAFT_42528 [Catenaria anguillulae PL171]